MYHDNPEEQGWTREREMQVLGGWICAIPEAVMLLDESSAKKEHIKDSLRTIAEANDLDPGRFQVSSNMGLDDDWQIGVNAAARRKLSHLADLIP